MEFTATQSKPRCESRPSPPHFFVCSTYFRLLTRIHKLSPESTTRLPHIEAMSKKLYPAIAFFVLVLGSILYFLPIIGRVRTSSQQILSFDIRERGIDGTIPENKEATKALPTVCSPRRKWVFIKTHKTGSCTAGVITRRYAIYHNLTVLYPAVASGPNMLAWPFQPAEEDYVHTPDEQYDVILNHMRFNKTWLRSKLPADTAYFSIIRKPDGHLKTAMNYYNLPKLMKIKSKNPVQTFLQDPWKYKHLSEAHFDFCDITWDGTRNHQAFDLGYPTKAADDMEQARRYISELEADFTTMLLLEHLDESLVLLRRLMCWEVRDVLYDTTPKNSRSYAYKKYIPTAEELANLRRWKAVDYLLYDTFNASLWRKIAEQGPDFYDELRYFQEVNKRVSTYCNERQKDTPELTMASSKWNSEFQVDADVCKLLKAEVSPLMKYIRKDTPNGRKGYDILPPRTNMAAIIRGEPTFKYSIEQKTYHKSKAYLKRKKRAGI
ncbi:GAL3ST1 [Branchiostoma lanceolatum]|uniref:GAL3ST1 protein n=1 Tax=Branchiostoma lanceolatum TaxID=7740 RepID=A0A8J9Z8Y6_BRALA|nr:GAL3ST1 [Branchiostoma lanceolatum]CAH1249526.1 GAL3ST1 [Branchiostoma lanceolatum]